MWKFTPNFKNCAKSHCTSAVATASARYIYTLYIWQLGRSNESITPTVTLDDLDLLFRP